MPSTLVLLRSCTINYTMFTKSATPATPVTRPKSHINDTVTWISDWYSPLEYNAAAPPNLRLKAWLKKSNTDANEVSTTISADVFDLEKYKYYEEPAAVDEVVEEAPQETAANSDLKLALSMDKKDDQISSLSGLGM